MPIITKLKIGKSNLEKKRFLDILTSYLETYSNTNLKYKQSVTLTFLTRQDRLSGYTLSYNEAKELYERIYKSLENMKNKREVASYDEIKYKQGLGR